MVAKIQNGSGGESRERRSEIKRKLYTFRVLTAFHSSTLANRNEQLLFVAGGKSRKAAADALEIQIKFTTVSRNFVNDAQHDADVCQTS